MNCYSQYINFKVKTILGHEIDALISLYCLYKLYINKKDTYMYKKHSV